jgi:hypothetical protein
MHDVIMDILSSSFYSDERVKSMIPAIEEELGSGTITSWQAAERLLDKYFKK